MNKIRKINLVLSFVLTYSLISVQANAQSPKWIVGSSMVTFSSGAAPVISSTITGTSYASSSNAAFDKDGNLLFYIKGEKVYNNANTYLGTLGFGILANSTEISIVNVPGSCNEFYVIAISAVSTCTTCPSGYVFYAKITVSGSTINIGTIQSLGYSGAGGFAISKLRKNKSRFLFYVGSTIEQFLITAGGITHDHTVLSNSGIGKDVELFEDPNTGAMKLGYINSSNMVSIVNLDASGNYINGSGLGLFTTISAIKGMEFINGNKVVLAQNNSIASKTGIAVIDLSSPTNVSYIPNSADYSGSYVERAKDGNLYATKEYRVAGILQGYKLGVIDVNNLTVTEVTGLTLPSVEFSGARLLPDQIDNEDYIGINYRAELIARDNSLDIGIEPNFDPNVWASPDIWNRRDNIGNPDDNQNPGYRNDSLGNLMKMRVKNIGCVTSDPSFVRMYWTLGATGEHWPGSWDGSTKINGQLAGQEITDGTYSTYTVNGYEVPALAPGAEAVIKGKWFPPDPAIYGNTSLVGPNAMICFLGRIDDPVHDPMYDEQVSNTASTSHNIHYNNNIVTSNTTLVNLPGLYKVIPRSGSLLVNNYLDVRTSFNIKFRSLTAQDVEFSRWGTVTLQLDDNLWNSWLQGGGKGDGIVISNPEQHQVIIRDFKNAVLRNVSIEPEQFMGITPIFQLLNVTEIKQSFNFAFSQEKTYPDDVEPYGSECNFIVTINGMEEPDYAGVVGKYIVKGASTLTGNIASKNFGQYPTTGDAVLLGQNYPNPADKSTVINFNIPATVRNALIQFTSVSGKAIKSIPIEARGKGVITISTSDLISGVYTYSLIADGKILDTKKMQVTK